MSWRTLVSESLLSAWTSRVSSLLTAIVVAATCAAALLTVGQTSASAARVAQQLEDAGARRLVITDRASGADAVITPATVAQVRSLPTVESVAALGGAFDVANGAIGTGAATIPAWRAMSDPSELVELVVGRWPRSGEALVSAERLSRLGMDVPVGFLASPTGAQFAVVGAFRPRTAHRDLAAGAIISAPEQSAQELRVVVGAVADAEATVTAVLAILAPPDQRAITVDSPSTLAAQAQQLSAELTGSARSLLLLIMIGSGGLVGAVVLSDVLVRRRDLGRRRTLGITRLDLVLLVALRTAWPALAAALVGTTAAWLWNARQGPSTPSDFAVSVGVLAVTTAIASCLLPAIFAAWRDPVRVLRTP